MADLGTIVDKQTVIPTDWTQALNNLAYRGELPSGSTGEFRAWKFYYDYAGLYIDRQSVITISRQHVMPTSVPASLHIIQSVSSDNTTFRGASGIYSKTYDAPGITADQRGALYGGQFSIQCNFVRSNTPFDDAACLVLHNEGTEAGTEMLYIGHNPGLEHGNGDAVAAIGVDCWTGVGIYFTGHYVWGLDFNYGPNGSTVTGGYLRGKNNVALVSAMSIDGTTTLQCLKLNTGDNLEIFGQERITRRDFFPFPTLSADSGTFTDAEVLAARWSKDNGLVRYGGFLRIDDKGTAAGAIRIPLPVTANQYGGGGIAWNTTDGVVLSAIIAGSATYVRLTLGTGGDPIVNGKDYRFDVTYEP